ncbi:MAG: hypothetical protein R3B70_33690 [Polyangiaceae bacterium]
MSTALPHYDPAAPVQALGEAGVSVHRSETTSVMAVDGMSLAAASSAGERWEVRLPAPANVQASFAREGVGKKLVKLFSKELQVGDKAFDDKVFISTGDKDATARFLANEDVRNLIAEFVGEGGVVEIDGTRMLVHAVNQGVVAVASEKDIARLICHVMAFAG